MTTPNPVESDGKTCPICHGSGVLTHERYGPDLWVMSACPCVAEVSETEGGVTDR